MRNKKSLGLERAKDYPWARERSADHRAISRSLRDFNKANAHLIKERVTLADVTTFPVFLRNRSAASRKQQINYLARHVRFIELAIATIAPLAARALVTHGANQILSVTFPGKDIHLGGSLTNIINTSLAIVKLASDGLEAQTRVLARTLDERIYQTMLLYSSPSDFAVWQEAQTDAQARAAWYSLFSRKQRRRKRLRQLEQALGLDLGEPHELWRDNAESLYSTAVHGGNVPVVLGAFGFAFDSDAVSVGLFGHASAAAKPTLAHIGFQLLYFVSALSRVLKLIHNWEPDISDPMFAYHVAFRDALFALAPQWAEQMRKGGDAEEMEQLGASVS